MTIAEKSLDAATHHKTSAREPHGPRAVSALSQLWPGLLLTAVIAGSGFALRRVPGVSIFSPQILAIAIGIALHNLVGTPARAKAGVTFSMRRILRFAIILLGLQLTVTDVLAVGATGVAIIVMVLVATFVFTTSFGRLIGVDRKLAELIAAGTSICGASAVIATNTVTNGSDEDVAYAVACVTVFGSIAMFLYPLAPELLHLTPHAYGLWAGASIHEIAQVAAAAFQDGRQAGELATIAKLSRVLMLAPVVISLGLMARLRAGRKDHGAVRSKAPIPWFVFGFLALVALNSVFPVPHGIKAGMASVTTFLMAVALAAMGLETDIRKLRARGLRPLLLGFAAFLFIAGLSLALVRMTGA